MIRGTNRNTRAHTRIWKRFQNTCHLSYLSWSEADVPSKRIPAHVLEALIAKGVLTTDRVSSRAKPMPCQKCGLITLAGFELGRGYFTGNPIWCEPRLLTADQEFRALIDGLRTVQLLGTVYDFEFRRRMWSASGPYRQAPQASPSVRDDVRVLAEHRCGRSAEGVVFQIAPATRSADPGVPPF